MFLDHLTVPAECFGDLDAEDCFVRERDLTPRGGVLPYPCIFKKTADGKGRRLFRSDAMVKNVPETETIASDEHVIVLH